MEPGLSGRYHLNSYAPRLRIPVCAHGLDQSSGVGIAAVQHANDRLLYGSSPAAVTNYLWRTDYLQPRSRMPVHQLAACRTSRIIKSQKTDAVLLHIGIMTRVPQQAGESV